MKILRMEALSIEVIEEELTSILQEVCSEFGVDVMVDEKFCPGNYIKSQVLLDTICTIEDVLGITIPNECYVFSDKNKDQLSIKQTAQKILQIANNGTK